MRVLLDSPRRRGPGGAWLLAFGFVLAATATVSAQSALTKVEAALGPQRRVLALLKDVNTLKGKESLVRWTGILKLTSANAIARTFMSQIASREIPVKDEYQRFVAAISCAGYRTPAARGPYPLIGNWPLRNYLGIMCDYRVSDGGKWRMSCDDDVAALLPVLPVNMTVPHYFHDTLWSIMEKYDLDFKTENTLALRITKRDKPRTRNGPITSAGLTTNASATTSALGTLPYRNWWGALTGPSNQVWSMIEVQASTPPLGTSTDNNDEVLEVKFKAAREGPNFKASSFLDLGLMRFSIVTRLDGGNWVYRDCDARFLTHLEYRTPGAALKLGAIDIEDVDWSQSSYSIVFAVPLGSGAHTIAWEIYADDPPLSFKSIPDVPAPGAWTVMSLRGNISWSADVDPDHPGANIYREVRPGSVSLDQAHDLSPDSSGNPSPNKHFPVRKAPLQ